MDICKRCGSELPENANYCPGCGRVLNPSKTPKKRGNGQGTVFKLENGHYMAQVTLGYYTDDDGKRHRRTRSKVYEKKKDAVAALATLLKRTAGADKDKMELIGHASGEMLRYYQDVELADLRRITDAI